MNLNSKDLLLMQDLCERVEAYGNEYNKDLFVEDQWTFKNPLKNSTWYVKLRVQRGLFISTVNQNGSNITPENCENVVKSGVPCQITGTFGIWMNAASGQYGISFASQNISLP